MSASSAIVKLGLATVAIPAIGFALGLQYVIPGCHCDEGAGCNGCGPANGLIEFLIFGGFIGSLLALIFALPASLVLASIVNSFSTKSGTQLESNGNPPVFNSDQK